MKRFFSRFVALPDPLKAAITAVVVALLGILFTNIIALVPLFAFLLPYIQPLFLVVATGLIALIEKAVPDMWGPVAIKAIEFLLLLLATLGIGQTLTAQGALPTLLMFP